MGYLEQQLRTLREKNSRLTSQLGTLERSSQSVHSSPSNKGNKGSRTSLSSSSSSIFVTNKSPARIGREASSASPHQLSQAPQLSQTSSPKPFPPPSLTMTPTRDSPSSPPSRPPRQRQHNRASHPQNPQQLSRQQFNHTQRQVSKSLPHHGDSLSFPPQSRSNDTSLAEIDIECLSEQYHSLLRCYDALSRGKFSRLIIFLCSLRLV